MTPRDMEKVYAALKSKNPRLKLHVVRYTWEKHEIIRPFLHCFDIINLWTWVSTEQFWRADYEPYLKYFKKEFDKEILQGIFLHNYGETWGNSEEALTPELIELICSKVFPKVYSGELTGAVFLQNGWFSRPNHRQSLFRLKEYLDWFIGTHTDPR